MMLVLHRGNWSPAGWDWWGWCPTTPVLLRIGVQSWPWCQHSLLCTVSRDPELVLREKIYIYIYFLKNSNQTQLTWRWHFEEHEVRWTNTSRCWFGGRLPGDGLADQEVMGLRVYKVCELTYQLVSRSSEGTVSSSCSPSLSISSAVCTDNMTFRQNRGLSFAFLKDLAQ